MVTPVSNANDEIFSRCNALIVGPGLGQSDDAVRLMMWSMKSAHVPTVMDADALNIAAARGMDWKTFSQPIVITPHPGEMSRLTGLRIAEIQQSRGKVAADYAQRHDVTVVLKDATTAIADPSGTVVEHHHPCVALATGGTGDVLSGLIGGFLAQGLAPLDAAYAGVVIHSEAGADVEARLGRAGAVASDVLAALPLAQEHQRRRLETDVDS
jgi:NAD(P)H-hydrate epimerase